MLIAGVLLLLLAVAHEYSWWRRRDWVVVPGRVVQVELVGNDRVVDEVLGHKPHIEYSVNGQMRRLRSNYGDIGDAIKVGDEVQVCADPNTGAAEQLSWSNRWTFTMVPAVLGLGALAISLI